GEIIREGIVRRRRLESFQPLASLIRKRVLRENRPLHLRIAGKVRGGFVQVICITPCVKGGQQARSVALMTEEIGFNSVLWHRRPAEFSDANACFFRRRGIHSAQSRTDFRSGFNWIGRTGLKPQRDERRRGNGSEKR